MKNIQYDYEYYEKGEELGISGYTNYRWMEEHTINLVKAISRTLNLKSQDKILDYGCAKGFVVKAFRLLGFKNTFGIDISEYAISNCDPYVSRNLKLYKKIEDLKFAFDKYDWVISKDVFEHIKYKNMVELSHNLSLITKNLYAIIPLGNYKKEGKFIINDYHNDKTHITILSISEWINLFEKDWEIINFTTLSNGVKDNWWHVNNYGNGFFMLKSRTNA